MHGKRSHHPDRKACKAYIQEMITWEHLALTKILVFGLAGIKILATKALLALGVMIATLFNFAPQYSKASDPTASTNGGILTAGGDTGGGRAATNGGISAGGDTNGGTTTPTTAGGTTAGGDTNGGGTTDQGPAQPTCTAGAQQGCTTNLSFPCQQGIQTCQQNTWGVCRPVGQTEICTDTFDNDCDGLIDGRDSDCGNGIVGCTNISACNFNQHATQDDGSCILPQGCTNRCPGDAGSIRQLDQCNICGGDNSSCSDCSGTPNGNKLNDQCGKCLSPSDPLFNDCLDCAGTPNGTKKIDSCDNCLAPTDPQFNACKDCKGIQGGGHKVDQCNVCLLPTDSAFDSCIDCAGVPFGTAKPGSTCSDGNPLTSPDIRAVDCSCVGTLQTPKTPTPKQPTPETKKETPTQTPTQQKESIPSPDTQTPSTPPTTPKNTNISLAKPMTPTAPTVLHSSLPDYQDTDGSISTHPSPTETEDATPQEEVIHVRTSKLLRIPIVTSVRQRLNVCIQNQGNILSCLMQKNMEQPTAPVKEDICCTLPPVTHDWTLITNEEKVILTQLEERNCLFRDDIGETMRTQGLDTYITAQEVEHALFHLFGGKVLPQEDNEHRRYWLQAKNILRQDYHEKGGIPVTYASLTTHLQAGLTSWTKQNQFPETAQNDHLVTRKEALHLFGEVSQFLAAHTIDTCNEKPLVIQRFPITKSQNDAYLLCRGQKSLTSCSYLLGLPAPKNDSLAQQIHACETVFGAEHPDCKALKKPELLTQTVAYDCTQQQAISPSECASLVALYTFTQGGFWNENDGWLQNESPCTWYGVSCHQGNVSHLTLANNNLRGILPELYLPGLQQLQLQGNALAGNLPLLPESTELEKLFLYDNAFVGTISSAYTHLTKLSHLYLGGTNQLCGTIPTGVKDIPLALAHTDLDNLQFVLKSCGNGMVCNSPQDCASNACNTSHLCIAPTEQKQLMVETLKSKAHQAGFTTQSVEKPLEDTATDFQHIHIYLSCLARGHTSNQCQSVLRKKK